MSPQKRIPKAQRQAALRVLRQQHALENVGVREQLQLLRQMRRDTLRALGEASGFRLFHLTQVLAAIDREIARGRAVAQQLASGITTRAYRLGASLVDGAVAAIGVASTLADVSPELLSAVLEVTNDQLRSVWSELGTRLKTTVRRAALGVTEPEKAIGQVAAAIRDVKTFGTAEARAETIIRTEVNRTFSLAAQRRLEQSNERLGGRLKKWWLATDDDRTRDAHREAGERYGPENAIPVDEPFVVDGEELMEPLDPAGSPENVINCRCRLVPYVDDVVVPEPLRLAS